MPSTLHIIVQEYSNKKDQELLCDILSMVQEESLKWLRSKRYPKINPEEFSSEVAIEFVKRLENGEVKPQKSHSVIKNICFSVIGITNNCYTRIKGDRNVKINNTENSLLQKANISKLIQNCNTKQKVLILYYLYYVPINKIVKIKHLLSKEDYAVVTDKVTSFEKSLFSDDFVSFLPSTVTGSALFLSLLFKENPSLGTLFVLVKDLRKLIQFIILNQGTTIEIPKITKVLQSFNSIGDSVKQIEKNKIKVKDISLLKEFLITPTNDVDLRPTIEKFLGSVLDSMLSQHNEYVENLLKSIQPDSSVKKLMSIYEEFNSQVHSQVGLMETINILINGISNEGKKNLEKL